MLTKLDMNLGKKIITFETTNSEGLEVNAIYNIYPLGKVQYLGNNRWYLLDSKVTEMPQYNFLNHWLNMTLNKAYKHA